MRLHDVELRSPHVLDFRPAANPGKRNRSGAPHVLDRQRPPPGSQDEPQVGFPADGVVAAPPTLRLGQIEGGL